MTLSANPFGVTMSLVPFTSPMSVPSFSLTIALSCTRRGSLTMSLSRTASAAGRSPLALGFAGTLPLEEPH